MSVQAADFSILLIALVTVLTITRTTYMPDASAVRKTLICLSVWIVPLATASIATGMREMRPVSGNWCWISPDRTDLRYALTHGWRIFIIVITVGIYSYIWWYMARHFRSMVSTDSAMNYNFDSRKKKKAGFREVDEDEHTGGSDSQNSVASRARISRVGGDDLELSTLEAAYVRESIDINDIQVHEDVDDYGDDNKRGKNGRASPILWTYNDPRDEEPTTDNDTPNGHRKMRGTDTQASEFPHRRKTREMEREIKRMLLLNAYPIMYIILWIPGLINRFLEASGNRSNSRALAALQASSQFVGLANALTYGFNVHIRKKVKTAIQEWKGRRAKGRKEGKIFG